MLDRVGAAASDPRTLPPDSTCGNCCGDDPRMKALFWTIEVLLILWLLLLMAVALVGEAMTR